MKVSDLKNIIARMDDNQEVDVTIPLKYIINASAVCEKRLYPKFTCPEEGYALNEFLSKDEWAEALDKYNSHGDISKAIIDLLDDEGILDQLAIDLVSFEVR